MAGLPLIKTLGDPVISLPVSCFGAHDILPSTSPRPPPPAAPAIVAASTAVPTPPVTSVNAAPAMAPPIRPTTSQPFEAVCSIPSPTRAAEKGSVLLIRY
ncbi:hypothetical protein EJP617_B060 (plasmid) [Erwinia sp. Ejp617]|nr:hypothetical protein EJP617_B060 [Erwinia sp. Ejp617]